MAGNKKRNAKGKNHTRELGRKERRKLKRKEERFYKKLIKKNKTFEDDEIDFKADKILKQRENLAHESGLRKTDAKKDVILSTYKSKIEKLEEKLTIVPIYAEDHPIFKKSSLKGAAKPANEIYPEYYPEIYEKMTEGERVEDLLEINEHKLSENEQTLSLLKLKLLFGIRLIQFHQTNKALKVLKEIYLDLDKESKVFKEIVSHRLSWLYINKGELFEARTVIENADKSSLFLVWDRFLVEFISCFLLEEDTKESKVKKALKIAINFSNEGKQILKLFLNFSEFEKKIKENFTEKETEEIEQRIRKLEFPIQVKVSESYITPNLSLAKRYVHRTLSCFKDADGIFEFIAKNSN